MAAPMDLNVPLEDEDKLLQKMTMLQQLGYEAVAVNNNMPTLLDPPQAGKKKKDKKPEIKSPEEILIKEEILKKKIGVTRQPFRQYSRISVILKSTAQANAIDSKPVQSYDIVAVQPTSEETFRQACTNLNVDVITIDATENLDYRFKRPTVHKAIERGIHFELQYSPALRDRSLRKYLISNAMMLMFFCKGKNVILTSGCEKPIETRGPHDVANLGLLFNLSEAQAKDAVTRNCRAVLKHSEARRMVRSVLTVTKVDSLPESENWIREKCNLDLNDDPEGLDSDQSESSDEMSDSDAETMGKKVKLKGKNVKKAGKYDVDTRTEKIKADIKTGSSSGNDFIGLDESSLVSVSPAKKMKTS